MDSHSRVMPPRFTGVSRERGAATVELAITLPVVVLMVLAILVAMKVAVVRVQVQDAARVGARVAMVNSDESAIVEASSRVAGAGATTQVSAAGEWVTVKVAKSVGGLASAWNVTSTHTAWRDQALVSAIGSQ